MMASETEVELKFMVPRQGFAALAADMCLGTVRVRRLLVIFYDTVDERLAASNVSVRLRSEGRRWVQTAEATLTFDPLQRLEHNVVLPASRVSRVPALDLGLHDATPADLVIRAALSVRGNGGGEVLLVEPFRTDVSRMTRVEQFEGACAEHALDPREIVAGSRSIPVCEFEMELTSGTLPGLFPLAAAWAGRHGLSLSSVSKARRGMRLVNGDAVKAANAEALRIEARGSPQQFLVAVSLSCLRQILGNASEIGERAALAAKGVGSSGCRVFRGLDFGPCGQQPQIHGAERRVSAGLAWGHGVLPRTAHHAAIQERAPVFEAGCRGATGPLARSCKA